MHDPFDITAEEILRGMIRDRIGSTDLKDIELAENCRKFMDGLGAIQSAIDTLGEAIQLAEDPGKPEQLAPELLAELREFMTQCAKTKSAMKALVVDPWKEGYERGWEDSTATQEREQMLATVIDLTSRLRG